MTHTGTAHWEAAYEQGADRVSWFQQTPAVSLGLIESLGLALDAPIIDIGGGASPLASALLDRGHRDVTVLDLSRRALEIARDALGERGDRVTWLQADLLGFTPQRTYELWHDRAVLHFLTDPADQSAYADLAARSVHPGGSVVIATFAPDGPERCSGLPVQRHDAASLRELLGPRFVLEQDARERHRTPGGSLQSFTWALARRRDEAGDMGAPGLEPGTSAV